MKYIIDFAQTATDAQIKKYLSDLKATSVTELNNFDKVFIVETDLTPKTTKIVDNVIEDSTNPIKLLDYVAEFNTTGAKVSIDTHAADSWWKLSSIANPNFDADSITHTLRGEQVNVYLVDSGIDATHSEFENTNIQNVYSITGDFTDTKGHGTALASVISSKTCSLSNANICNVKIFDESRPTYQSDMLTAFDAIIQHRLDNNNKVSVVNLSWAINKNSYIESKIQNMIDQGFFVVCSAGNSGVPIDDVTPASMDSVITVGAYNENLEPCDFSNYSNDPVSVTPNAVNTGMLDGWAPGEKIRAAGLGNTYTLVNGTSIASAIHSASIAYNLYIYLLDDDKFAPCEAQIEGNSVLASRMSFAKTGLLHLTEKYASSVNKITTYSTDESVKVLSGGMIVRAKVGEQICRRLFVNNIASIKILGESSLPYGLSFSGRYLLGLVPPISTNAEYTKYNCEITTLDGEVSPYELTIGIVNNTVDESTVVTGEDPILDLVLNASQCCTSGSGLLCVEGTSSCTDTVGGAGSVLICASDFTDIYCSNPLAKAGGCYCNPDPG